MKCPVCGKETPVENKKCVNCGAELSPIPRDQKADKPSLDTAKTQISPGARPLSSPPQGTPKKEEMPPHDVQKKQPTSGQVQREGTQVIQGGGQKPSSPPSGAPIKPPAPKPASPSSPQGTPSAPISKEEQMLRTVLSDRYEVIRKLGAGGMANVYLAREIALSRDVAIKVLPQAYTRDEQFVARFKREAQVAANLEHPHVVRIYQISEEKDLCYFVMSFIPGGSLTDQIKKRGALPVKDIILWGRDICSALGYAHDHGVIHRDLKPDNVMLDQSGRAVVMDFGIARAAQGSSLTQTGAVIGTPQYMSPEQARGIDLDARSDIYSMGMMLYQMATASLPFEATDAASLMYMHVHEAPEPPDVRNSNVPPWLRDIILKCLAKNPVDRFASVRELREALEAQMAPELKETPLKARKRAKKRTTLYTGIATAIIALAVVAGWFWWQSKIKQIEQTKAAQEQVAPGEKPGSLTPSQETMVTPDDLSFQQAEMINTIQSYSTYLEKYPTGKHIDDAKVKLTALQEKKPVEVATPQVPSTRGEGTVSTSRRDQEEKNRQDDQMYQQASMLNTKAAYTAYLETFPKGRHVNEVNQKLTVLDKTVAEQERATSEDARRKESEAFQMAMKNDTKEAYTNFLISFPSGTHSTDARSRLASIEERGNFDKKVKLALSSLSIKLVDIPGGTFRMGSEKGDKDEKPILTVSIAGFQMSSTEVTQGQYQAVMGSNPAYHKLDDNNPVERVTWQDAITFCNKLSAKAGLDPCYNLTTGACDFTKNGFRLPTEAEWEYACRAEMGSDYNTGDGESALARAGWYVANSAEKTHPVGQKTANTFGLYDMHGNVWEWCWDWYDKKSYESDKNENPTGISTGTERVVRGGSWLDRPSDCRSAKRRGFSPTKNYSDIGFRVVRR